MNTNTAFDEGAQQEDTSIKYNQQKNAMALQIVLIDSIRKK
jgi:hypothetical protein